MKTFELGLKEESWWSVFFHGKGIPILISQDLLRKKGLGQVDLCFFKKEDGVVSLQVVEVKSPSRPVLSNKQRRRLLGTCSFLSKVFNISSKLLIKARD